MSVLPRSLFEALEADASLWPGVLREEDRSSLERTLGPLPSEVRDVVLGAVLDPERNDWGRAAVHALAVAESAGARVTGMATDETIAAEDRRGERFGLQPLGMRLPADPSGAPEDVRRLAAGLDRAFGERRYVLYLRRPVPSGLDVQPILRAVQLWLAQIDRGERAETHAVYEDDEVAIDLTLVDGAKEGVRGGRMLTIGPVPSLDRLGQVDPRVVEAAARCEESLGDLPVVVALDGDRPWRIGRGFLQQLLYGTADRIGAGGAGETPGFEAAFTPNGRSLFSDPACRAVTALWWLEPDGAGRVTTRVRAYENPWTPRPIALAPFVPRFAAVGEPDRRGAVTLRWFR